MARPAAPAARAEPDPQRPLGFARIVLTGLSAAPADPRFGLLREGVAAAHLGPSGWQMGEALLSPEAVTLEDGATVLVIGPSVCRHLEPGPLTLRLPALRLELALFWPSSIAVFDPGEARIGLGGPRPAPAATRATTPRAAVPPPSVAPPSVAPPVAPPPARRRPVLPILLAVAALLAALGAAAMLLAPGLIVPGRGPGAPTPVAAPVWPEGTDQLTPAEIVARAPDARGVLAVALRRQARDRHDDALVLFEVAAEAGLAEAHTALGRLYDPIGFVPGRPFRSPDLRQAARAYREGERLGDTQASALRDALRAYLEREAAAGNGTARDALREFWP